MRPFKSVATWLTAFGAVFQQSCGRSLLAIVAFRAGAWRTVNRGKLNVAGGAPVVKDSDADNASSLVTCTIS